MGLPNAAWIHFSQIWFQFTRTNRGFVLKRFPYFRFTSTRRINFIKSSLKIRVACPLRNCSSWMRRYVRRKRARAVYTLRWSTNKTQNTTRTKEHHCAAIERFSIECRESKTKEVTLASHKWHRQSSEQSKFKANACGRREERENVCKRVAIGWFRTTEGGASFYICWPIAWPVSCEQAPRGERKNETNFFLPPLKACSQANRLAQLCKTKAH